MVSNVSNNVGLNPLINNNGQSAKLSSSSVDSSKAIINMLPEVQQKEMLLLLQQMLKGVDAGSLNAELLLKIIEQYQDGVEDGTGVFIDTKV